MTGTMHHQEGTGNECVEVRIDPARIVVSDERIAFDLGYGAKGIPEPFGEMITGIVDHLPEYCEPRAGYTIREIFRSEGRNDGFTVGNHFLNLQKIIAFQLLNAEKAVLFTCTIGDAMEKLAAEYFHKGDPVMGHFTDTVASAAVEQVAGILHDHIASTVADSGLGITNRFSPGYCGWPVTEQHALFSFFPERFCGITVTDSALMLPKKSVSGIIGVGPNAVREPYFCERCNRRECSYRTYRQLQAQVKDNRTLKDILSEEKI